MILNFTVPETLYGKIEAYDSVKPKVQSTKSPKKSSTFPKAGIPENLVPENVLPKQQLLNVIGTINSCVDSFYGHVESQHISHNHTEILVCKLGNKYWFAIWFDRNNDETIFHYSLCMRNLFSYKTYRNKFFFEEHNISEEDFEVQKHNKKEYLYLFRSVTPEDIKTRKYKLFPNFPVSSAVRIFTNTFKIRITKYINVWDNALDPFKAYNTSLAMIFHNYSEVNNFNWIPDLNFFIKSARVRNEIVPILETPFFKREIQNYIQSTIDEYNSLKDLKYISINQITIRLRAINFVNYLYGDEISLDLYQQIWNSDLGSSVYSFDSSYISEFVCSWMQNNVPVKSFVNMLIRSHSEITDSIGMLSDILRKNGVITYEGRWRPKDFHDHIMSEHWKFNNKNEKLDQDLFPQPLKVENMTYIQPIDTHQLSKWGRAVKNCVGNSTYINGVKKKTHFIVLGLKNNEPYLTVQATLQNQNFKVVQIKKICNANLNNSEMEEFNTTFSKALEIRTKEIADVKEIKS